MREKRLNEFKAVLLGALGLMILISLLRLNVFESLFYTSPPVPSRNLLGVIGSNLAAILIFFFGRITGFLIPVLFIAFGIKYFRQQPPYLNIPRLLGILVLLLSVASFIGLIQPGATHIKFYWSGFFGAAISDLIATYFSRLGGFIIFTTFILLSLALVSETLLSSLFASSTEKFKDFLAAIFKHRKKEKATFVKVKSILPEKLKIDKEESLVSRPKIQIKTKPVVLEAKVKPQELKIGDYHFPSLDLLDVPPPLEARQIKEDLEVNARILEDTLGDFGIIAKVKDIERGPIITRYELEPAPGVKLSRIVTLSDDIALNMKAQSVRILAPIPGKDRVGIEVPNIQGTFVYLREVFASNEFQKTKTALTLALGKDITGQPIIADLDDMPHLLIAGTTGSGKTVCVNSLILSLIFKNSPTDLKFVMIDPKMVELMPFNGLPHLLCPVVTDSKKAYTALNWVVGEMEERYQLLAKAGARNIEAYNEKEEKLPFIIVIVDEFADLMNVARDQTETAVQRIAQLSRAVGIHLILATQRPSVNVITGVIKANLPARVSFKVASKVDSRTVLDMNGADKLLGKGDMLFLRPGESKPIRIQGTLISDKEIERVVDFIKSQAEPVYNEQILKEQQKSGMSSGEKDEFYDEAVKVIMESNQASVSILQRRMRLGYTRAARIIDMMEQDGLVGPFEGSKPRRILIDREAWLRDTVAQAEDKPR